MYELKCVVMLYCYDPKISLWYGVDPITETTESVLTKGISKIPYTKQAKAVATYFIENIPRIMVDEIDNLITKPAGNSNYSTQKYELFFTDKPK